MAVQNKVPVPRGESVLVVLPLALRVELVDRVEKRASVYRAVAVPIKESEAQPQLLAGHRDTIHSAFQHGKDPSAEPPNFVSTVSDICSESVLANDHFSYNK